MFLIMNVQLVVIELEIVAFIKCPLKARRYGVCVYVRTIQPQVNPVCKGPAVFLLYGALNVIGARHITNQLIAADSETSVRYKAKGEKGQKSVIRGILTQRTMCHDGRRHTSASIGHRSRYAGHHFCSLLHRHRGALFYGVGGQPGDGHLAAAALKI